MHVLHEIVEMHPAFAIHGNGFVKQVHQHRFAAPDFAVNIKALRRFGFFAAARQAKPFAPAARPGMRFVMVQRLEQALQFFGTEFLHGIMGQFARGDFRAVT